VDRRSPLLQAHRRLGARLVDFAGWDMPLQYEGIVAEHNAVRTGVGVGDVSHLGKLALSGPAAEEALQTALTCDAGGLAPGRAKYALVLTDGGGCIDDVFVYRIAVDEWLVVPNAANVAPVSDAIASAGAQPRDEWDRWAILAIQGPESFPLVERAWPGSGAPDLRLHAWAPIEVFGAPGMIARTGYTGERGFELYVDAAVAERAFDRLLELGGTPVGLGARDTLRLEMGYPLYGHELDRDVSPLEAGLEWALAWETPFRGRPALEEVRRAGPTRRLFGVRCTERGVPRRGHEVLASDARVGTVTSGNYSPTLGTGIALARGDSRGVPEPDSQIAVAARGRRIGGILTKPPFIPRP
jgi:aminomethyltransferase